MTKLLVVKRESHEENTFAVVRWGGSCPPEKLRERVTQAVTDWIAVSSEGKEAWDDSSENFNIGDLANHTGNAGLAFILAQYGIMDLEIDVFSDESHSLWAFDDILNTNR